MALPPEDVAELARFRRAQVAAAARTPGTVDTTTLAGINAASGTSIDRMTIPAPTTSGGAKTPTWVRAKTVQTANGPVDVDASGKAADGSTPVESTPQSNTFTEEQVNAKIADAIAKFKADQTATNRSNVTTALEDFRSSLKLAGLDTLVDTIDGFIKQDMTASQIKINLTQTDAYKARFPGMDALAKAGRAVNEATYISMERGYEQVLGAYGLDTKVFGTREKLGSYIAGEVSPVEFENRVQIAADRVNKNPDVLAALKDYYGVDKSGAIAYLLDPNIGMDIVKKQARAAEIGAAAQAAGFSEFLGQPNAGVAESFINASGTQDLQSLKTEFGKARLLANTQERLSQIENGKYNDLEAITAVVGQDAQKMMESQRRAAREAARFGGTTGVTTQSLRSNIGSI